MGSEEERVLEKQLGFNCMSKGFLSSAIDQALLSDPTPTPSSLRNSVVKDTAATSEQQPIQPEIREVKNPRLSPSRSHTTQNPWSKLHQSSQLHFIAELWSPEGRRQDDLDRQKGEIRFDITGLGDLSLVHEELVQAIKDAEEGLLHLNVQDYYRKQIQCCTALTFLLKKRKWSPLIPQMLNQSRWRKKAIPLDPNVDSVTEMGGGTMVKWCSWIIQWQRFRSLLLHLRICCSKELLFEVYLSNASLQNLGVDVQLPSLKKYAPTVWNPSLVGSTIWAVSNANAGIWREAELESWNEEAGVGQVVFRDDGSSMKLGAEGMVLSEYAEVSDLESDSSLEQSDSSDYEEEEEEESQGLGFLESTNLQKDPIPVKVLPPKQSLDHALESHKGEEITEKQGKKGGRGGKKKTREEIRRSKSWQRKRKEESASDVFTLINIIWHCMVDRRALIAYEDEVKDLKVRVEKLEQMVNANRKEKAVYDAAMRKLIQTRKALADAEAVHASASNAVVSKEKEKRWLKF
ncbi:putative zinc finger CCCH domain-containing protein 18-like [Sesbania bispinosa]|nr:putative zinc finger CCCH domain-containing protein 18-like [Sesbania bispinosa]